MDRTELVPRTLPTAARCQRFGVLPRQVILFSCDDGGRVVDRVVWVD